MCVNINHEPKIIELDLASADNFSHYIGEIFYMNLSNGKIIPLTLQSVAEHPSSRMHSAPPERRMPFSLSFSGLKDETLLTDNVRLQHDSAGVLENVAIVQILPQQGLAAPESWYQIVFG